MEFFNLILLAQIIFFASFSYGDVYHSGQGPEEMTKSDFPLESEMLRQGSGELDDDPEPYFRVNDEGMHTVRNDMLEKLRIDSKYIDALKSLGLKSLKLVVVDVPEKKSMENSLPGEMETVNEKPMLNFDTARLPEPRHSSATLEHDQKALLKLERAINLLESLRNNYLSRLEEHYAQNTPNADSLHDYVETRNEQKFRHPDYVKFANEASNLGIPQFNDINKGIKYFWKPNQYQG